ncbi:zinc finger, CCHC-type containing protein [Tanacetum coccineum]
MLSKNKLGSGNKRLNGRDWTDYDVKSLREMLKKIDEILKHREQLRRLEEYVGGRPKTVNPMVIVEMGVGARTRSAAHIGSSSIGSVHSGSDNGSTSSKLEARVCIQGVIRNSLEAKYMAEDASSKKFLVSNFTNYKMTYSRPVMEQYNELLVILEKFTQHKMNMDEAGQKYFKHTLKHQKEELTLVEWGSHMRIEESLRVQDNDKPKGNNVAGPSVVNMMKHNNSFRHLKKDCKGGKVGNKAYGSGTNGSVDGSNNSLKGQNMFNKSLQVYYVTYVSKAYFVQDDDVAWWVDSGAIDEALDKFKVFKTEVKLQQGSLIKRFTTDMGGEYMDTLYSQVESRVLGAVVRLPNPKLKTLGKRGIECIFVRYANHSKAIRFYVIEPNESILINSIIESVDVIFNEYRFSLVPRPSLRIPNGTEDTGGSVVPEEVTEEIVTQQPGHETRKSKWNRTPKNFGPEFQLYLIEGTRDEVSDQHSYCFNVENDAKTFDEAIKCHDGFRQKSRIDYFDTYALVARFSTIRLMIDMASIYNLIIHQMDVKTTFLNGELEEEVYMNQAHGFIMPDNENKVLYEGHGEVDVISDIRIKHESNRIAISQSHYIKKVLKKFNYFDCTPVSTPIDTSEKLMPNNGQAISQLEYSRVIGCLMYAMTCTRPDIAFAVVLEGYTDTSWINNTKDNSSTSGWAFLLGGGTISWAYKKQTCITSSTMESKFVALATAGTKAEWLRNLILEIPL